jgi:hypothetical protein
LAKNNGMDNMSRLATNDASTGVGNDHANLEPDSAGTDTVVFADTMGA